MTSALNTHAPQKISLMGRISLRAKINLLVSLIFLLVISVITSLHTSREYENLKTIVGDSVKDLTNVYYDNLLGLMLSDNMKKKGELKQRFATRGGIIEARVIRAKIINSQYGPGEADQFVRDDLDQAALNGKPILDTRTINGRKVLTVITPMVVGVENRDVDCGQCHAIQAGDVLGALRISYDLESLYVKEKNELYGSLVVNALIFLLGLIGVNILLKRWIVSPLNDLLRLVNARANGDTEARANIASSDELGQLGKAFNVMAYNVNLISQREHAAADELKRKVDILLGVVSKVAEGDFSATVDFRGEDAIGNLAEQLQVMINFIKVSIEEKRHTLEDLKTKVGQLLSVVSKAAQGDLTGTVNLHDEGVMGQLADGIRAMVENLNELVAQVQRSGIQVASSATAIAATAKEQEATVAEQAATTNEIVSTATQISTTARDLLHTMTGVANTADQAAQVAEAGQAGLEHMQSTIGEVVKASHSVAAQFHVLSEKAQNINAVVTTITKVADQTNLLSLNAAIEAEKAGEFGLGFSVVASEIRRLADQTAVATLDIEQMVKEMQEAVNGGVSGMEEFAKLLNSGVNDVKEVSKQLVAIIQHVQTLTPRFDSVYQGMQLQSKGAEQINQAMISLNDAAQQTVESLRDSNFSIDKLNEAARDLQSGVIIFKVNQ